MVRDCRIHNQARPHLHRPDRNDNAKADAGRAASTYSNRDVHGHGQRSIGRRRRRAQVGRLAEGRCLDQRRPAPVPVPRIREGVRGQHPGSSISNAGDLPRRERAGIRAHVVQHPWRGQPHHLYRLGGLFPRWLRHRAAIAGSPDWSVRHARTSQRCRA